MAPTEETAGAENACPSIDINDRIRRLKALLSMLAGSETVLFFDLSGGPIAVHARPDLIDYMLFELVRHARDTLTGGGHVRLLTRRASHEAVIRLTIEGRPAHATSDAPLLNQLRQAAARCHGGLHVGDGQIELRLPTVLSLAHVRQREAQAAA